MVLLHTIVKIRSSWALKSLLSAEARTMEDSTIVPITLSLEGEKGKTYVFHSNNERLGFLAILREMCRCCSEVALHFLQHLMYWLLVKLHIFLSSLWISSLSTHSFQSMMVLSE